MGISIWQLLIVLVIILLLFGTKKLRSIGSDLGGAVKGFRESMTDKDEDAAKEPQQLAQKEEERVIDGEVAKRDSEKTPR